MIQYITGFMTGAFLVASVFLFISAKSSNQEYDDWYDYNIWNTVQDIESKLNNLDVNCNGGYVDYVNEVYGSVECSGGYVNCY